MTQAQKDNQQVSDRLRLSSPTIYEIIATEGRKELRRPLQSLAWSALVAGICMSFCLFCEGFIRLHTPDTKDYYLLENIGYIVGFMIVILGRFQLFTENTITVILPLLENFSVYKLNRVIKLWGIVFGFNMIGTFLIALLTISFSFFSADQMAVFIEISHKAVDRGMIDIFLQAIPAGFLIAALVWMLPSAEGNQFWVIGIMVYVIAIGDFAHIIAGSFEVFLLFLDGSLSVGQGLGYLVMACAGNIIGGTGLFALMTYAQVREEM